MNSLTIYTMMTIDEINTIMSQGKKVDNYPKYVKIYEQLLHRKLPSNGCGSCKLTMVYNSILQELNKLKTNNN